MELKTSADAPTAPLATESAMVAPTVATKKGRYLFDVDTLHAIAKKGIGLSHPEMVKAIADELDRVYPGFVNKDVEWIYNITAGATGIMKILHASITEYVILFGTPIGTEGFSGRYRMDIYDFQIAGETWTYTEENIAERKVCKPGDVMFLKKGIVKGFRILEGGWMLEYGRGFVPAALPLALGDSVFSALDGTTIVKTLWYYGKEVCKSLLKGKL